MAASEIEVKIKAKFDVDKQTAETCLKLVEMYVNANNVTLVHGKRENGETYFEYRSED